MNEVDYLVVLLSIVIGLAMTNVLTRLALVMQARHKVNFYWPPIAWAIWIFFICVENWWSQWSANHIATHYFWIFLVQLGAPVALFLLSALVLPDREEENRIDLEAWYFHNRRWYFGLLFTLPLFGIVEELLRTGRIASMLNLGFLIAFEIVIAIGYFVKSRRAGEWITGQLMAMTVVYVALLFTTLPP